MNPSNPLKLLGISILCGLGSSLAIADAEFATAADLVALESSQQRLQAQIEERLQIRVESRFETDLDQILAAHTTALLRRQAPVGGEVASPPAAIRGASESRPTSNTICTMVGRTLECVLRKDLGR